MEWLRSLAVNALLFKFLEWVLLYKQHCSTLMEFFTLFYHIWFYKTVLITYAQFTFCLFSMLFSQIPIYSIVTTCSFYFNSEKTSQRKSYQMLFARTTDTPGVFLAVVGSWTFTFIPLRILDVFKSHKGVRIDGLWCGDYLPVPTVNASGRRSRPVGKKEVFVYPNVFLIIILTRLSKTREAQNNHVGV